MSVTTPNSLSKRAIIFTGGHLGQWSLDHLLPTDYVIGADRGAEFLSRNGIVPHLALGDFDSVTSTQMDRIRTMALELLAYDPIDKDWTDTELALREAISRGYRNIALLGAFGTRFDHVLGNVHLLRHALEENCELTLIDDNNEVRLCDGSMELVADARFPHTSLLPLTLEVTGVTLEGFRYPLFEATLKLGWSIGISNLLDAPTGTISIKEGLLLVIRSRD